MKVDLAAAAKVQKDRNRLQSEVQECHAAIEEMAAEAETLRKSVSDKNRTIHELRGVQQEARDLQEETLHLKSEVQRLTKSSMDKVRLQQDLAEALAKVEELGGDAIKHAKLASERTKLLDQMDRLQEECETVKLEAFRWLQNGQESFLCWLVCPHLQSVQAPCLGVGLLSE